MLTFHRTYIDQVMIVETGKTIAACKLYNIYQGGERLARFYSGGNYSFAEFAEQKIRINTDNGIRRGEYHFVYNQYTKEQIGYFIIPVWRIHLADVPTKLRLADGQHYTWTENTAHRSILKPITRSTYRFDFLSPHHSIVYYGKMIPNVSANFVNPNQVFTGEIQTTNDQLLLPIVLGIYIMEEKFRSMEQEIG